MSPPSKYGGVLVAGEFELVRYLSRIRQRKICIIRELDGSPITNSIAGGGDPVESHEGQGAADAASGGARLGLDARINGRADVAAGFGRSDSLVSELEPARYESEREIKKLANERWRRLQ